MTKVKKDTFETRMYMREFDNKIRKLEERIDEIENKQANRFPHLIERLERLENGQTKKTN
jgi:predicted  nucleic acid-binding Zn-ribbon protein